MEPVLYSAAVISFSYNDSAFLQDLMHLPSANVPKVISASNAEYSRYEYGSSVFMPLFSHLFALILYIYLALF
jgi:hypothetical protein